MPQVIGFDVYGTLVDPLEMNEHLRPLVGERADRMSELWREKQLEYTFRRGLMRSYEDFGVCTKQALEYAATAFGVELSREEESSLISAYQHLRAFPDVAPGLEEMQRRGHTVVAFSNGVARTARALLKNAGVLEYLDDVISVDEVRTFKPAPEVYEHLARRLERPVGEVWLVSSNPFDVIGAGGAGLRTAWIQRSPDAVFDPWDFEPDLTAKDLITLAEKLR